ncbi:SseB family protein [Kutzneria sp. CA-103260]|uniref:SseB family protein n=1 Tax=Kutzneria sp. CA-103260 TaxID=2802641 RepID=UPI001BAABEEE|nr:SseB family protein [Kutzneria sp. CA-103260]QUQ70351.1 SseB family protein [Kutzneria sp. CA-103260]
MALVGEITAYHERRGDPEALLAAFREALVLVPEVETEHGGLRWWHAFTDERELAMFARARGEGDREWSYVKTRGERLLQAIKGRNAAIMVDAAGERPMAFT